MPNIDLAKRRRIMQRSMELGHCICDPKRPCPCDVFTGQGICPCAGERPEPVDLSTIKLTELVHNAGCASKISPEDLETFLSRLPAVKDPAVISGLPAGDDAGVYRLGDGMTLVQTVDIFTPCVDDPYTFGKICAANCLSDIYAMGAVPKTALSVLCFPAETMNGEVMYEMMKGAMEVLEDAECALLGGHSIKDEEIKLGFAITGVLDEEASVSHETASVGDVLVLTKPLGVGVLSFARQIGRVHEQGLRQAEKSMIALNRDAAALMSQIGVSACTDVTGFSLLGHLARMVRHSKVTARIYADALPVFDGALELLEQGVIPGAIERNREFVGDDLIVRNGITEAYRNLGFDAQTSGGLLIAVPEEKCDAFCTSLSALKDDSVAPHVIGKIVEHSDGKIEMVASADPAKANLRDTAKLKVARPSTPPAEPTPPIQPARPEAQASGEEPEHDPGCCADVFGEPAPSPATPSGGETVDGSTAPVSMAAFGDLMQSSGATGLLDEKTKELITFSLVLHSRCEPCLAIHYEKALGMGITQEELDEVAWCAIAMGGAPVKMFYQAYREKIGN